jgi:GR25 family glycosyltransferase involved in LPS biosynthesis
MKGIDFIYIINLDERPKKFAKSFHALKKYGIIPYRFSAVNGWTLPLEVIQDIGLKYQAEMVPLANATVFSSEEVKPYNECMREGEKTYFCHDMTRGALGICMSHFSILKDAWDSGYETIWVMEDDIEVTKNPHYLSILIQKLDALVGKDNWDILFTDQNTKDKQGHPIVTHQAPERPDMDCSLEARFSEKYSLDKEISPDFRKIGARFGAYSMIIRRSGIKKLLDFVVEHKIFYQYDIDNFLPEDIHRYSLNYDVVSTLAQASTDNRYPGYQLKSIKKAKKPVESSYVSAFLKQKFFFSLAKLSQWREGSALTSNQEKTERESN